MTATLSFRSARRRSNETTMLRHRYRLLSSFPPVFLALLLLSAGLTGCNLNVFNDSISTRVEIQIEDFNEPVSASKRFRFERDVEDASSAFVDRAWIAVDEPGDLDLSFVSRVLVWVIDPATGERELLLEGGGFKPGERRQRLEIIYMQDVRKFVEDQRVNLDWQVEPNRLYRQGFSTDLAALRFGIVLEIDTD